MRRALTCVLFCCWAGLAPAGVLGARGGAEAHTRKAGGQEPSGVPGEDRLLWRYHALRAHLDSRQGREDLAARRQRPRPGQATRGIMIAAGGPVLLNHTWALLEVLRDRLGCQLPVELFYNGPGEMSSNTKAAFEGRFQGVACVDGSAHPLPAHHRWPPANPVLEPPLEPPSSCPRPCMLRCCAEQPWAYRAIRGYIFKTFCLCFATSFDQVLLLDADNTPLVDPEYLFAVPEFQRHGNLYFPDWWGRANVQAGSYTIFGLKPPWEQEREGPPFRATETGAVLMDRHRNAEVLEWVWFLGSNWDGLARLVLGDKDTHRIAFGLGGRGHTFQQVAIAPRACLEQTARGGGADDSLRHVGMVQHDPQGKLAFLHRTADGKFDPRLSSFRRCNVLTVPLSPERAAPCLGSLVDAFGFASHQVDFQALEGCPGRDAAALHSECGLDLGSPDLPIPVEPLGAWADVEGTVRASDAALERRQQAHARQ